MKFSVNKKILIFSCIILVFNVFIGYTFYDSKRKLAETEQLVQHTEDVISRSSGILLLFKDIENAARGFVLTGDSTILSPLFIAEKTIFSSIGQLRKMMIEKPAQQQRLDSISIYVQNRLDFSLHQVKLRSNKGLESAIAYSSTNKGKYYSDRMSRLTNDIQMEEVAVFKRLKSTNERRMAIVNWFSAGMFVLMTGFTLFLLYVTAKYLLQIKEKEKHAEELVIANNELAFQYKEKERMADELILKNEEQRETNEYLGNLLDCANAPIIVWDTHFKITRFNKAFESLTGRIEKDVIGKTLEILFPTDSVDSSMDFVKRTHHGE